MSREQLTETTQSVTKPQYKVYIINGFGMSDCLLGLERVKDLKLNEPAKV